MYPHKLAWRVGRCFSINLGVVICADGWLFGVARQYGLIFEGAFEKIPLAHGMFHHIACRALGGFFETYPS